MSVKTCIYPRFTYPHPCSSFLICHESNALQNWWVAVIADFLYSSSTDISRYVGRFQQLHMALWRKHYLLFNCEFHFLLDLKRMDSPCSHWHFWAFSTGLGSKLYLASCLSGLDSSHIFLLSRHLSFSNPLKHWILWNVTFHPLRAYYLQPKVTIFSIMVTLSFGKFL